jgi:hypothetical protein
MYDGMGGSSLRVMVLCGATVGCVWGRHVQAEAVPHADASELLAYVDTVIKHMYEAEVLTAERKKRVAEMERVLLRLKRVIAVRLKSEFSAADALTFDAKIDEAEKGQTGRARVPAFNEGLDDGETLLRLMHAIDSGVGSNGDGAISEPELQNSSHLSAEMKQALRSAFGCTAEVVKEALSKVKLEDFSVYKRANRKASVNALLDALGPSAAAAGWNKKAGLELLATKLKEEKLEELASALTGLSNTLLSADAQLDFLALKRGAQRVPRVRGPRLEWARGLGLDGALARQLPPGILEDGLAGVRGMPWEEAKRAVEAFLEDARVRIYTALMEVKTAKGSRSAAEANAKFDGFQGTFATLPEFHAGAEASLNLGYPNPDTMRGILNEHTKHPSVTRLFVTPNYQIASSLLLEFAWAVQDESPEDLEAVWTGDSFPLVSEQLERARQLLRKLVEAREGAEAASAKTDSELLFPGEVGDRFSESLVMLRFSGVAADSAEAKKIGDQAKAEAAKLLMTDEEQARGVAILDHAACVERIQGTGSLLQGPSSQAAFDDGLLRVGVLLPMSSVRAEAILDQLLADVMKATEQVFDVAEKMAERTWAFSRFTSVQELRKWLEERSLADLRKVLAADGKGKEGGRGKEWAYVDRDDVRWANEDPGAYLSLCEAMVSSFVCTELQADLRAALESRASEAQLDALLTAWGLTPKSEKAARIEQAAAALDEKRWSSVEGWVRLHTGRIQGRMRLGLRALMAREAKNIDEFKLTASEVLGTNIYTGANFVLLNGICRSFPPSILELLKGDATTGDNRMCTTLFCISSCLKKLSQHTELPESRCRPFIPQPPWILPPTNTYMYITAKYATTRLSLPAQGVQKSGQVIVHRL